MGNFNNKKGVSGVITIIVFVAIAIIAIATFAGVLFNIIYSKGDETIMRSKFLDSNVKVVDFKSYPDYIDISLSNTAGKSSIENKTSYTTTEIVTSDTDIISVIDLSGSMQGTKISLAKDANIDFINEVISGNGEHKIGLVSYSNSANREHDLSRDNDSLISAINFLSATGATCICCGINEAVDMIKDSVNSKMMIVMSDGDATRTCSQQGTGDSSEDTIQAAKDAYENYGIVVHTIAFGTGSDIETMNKTAIAGNGNLYVSNIAGLSDIYSDVTEEVQKTEVTHKTIGADCIRFLFLNQTHSYKYDDCDALEPGGTKRYIVPDSKNLDEYITNITSLEIYSIALDQSGKEHISHLMGRVSFD